MPVIHLRTEIDAPVERVFDLCRSVEVHLRSTGRTREEVVAGVTSGLMGPDDEVTWEATHLGLRQRLTSRITRYERPRMFRDSMVRGAFRRFDHDHLFTPTERGTLVEEQFDFDAPLGPLGWIANRLFLTRTMHRFLAERLEAIKRIAESREWEAFLMERG